MAQETNKQICSDCGGEHPHATVICVRNLQKKLQERLDTRAFSLLETLADYLEEAHEQDKEDGHAGDDAAGYTCSYCEAIGEARKLLEEWRGQEKGEDV